MKSFDITGIVNLRCQIQIQYNLDDPNIQLSKLLKIKDSSTHVMDKLNFKCKNDCHGQRQQKSWV